MVNPVLFELQSQYSTCSTCLLLRHGFCFQKEALKSYYAILKLTGRDALKIFVCPKRKKQTTGSTKPIFPYFLWAITQIKPGKLRAFFLWNASINAVKTEQRDSEKCLVAISPVVDGRALFADAQESVKHIKSSLHAHVERKEISIQHKL